uniref:Putative secreted protein n=1 Tax=Anopheles darlingi TaxID=43151 RepID=A0A2M4DNH2_ANODA
MMMMMMMMLMPSSSLFYSLLNVFFAVGRFVASEPLNRVCRSFVRSLLRSLLVPFVPIVFPRSCVKEFGSCCC